MEIALCVHVVWRILSNISWYILDQFNNLFTIWKRFTCRSRIVTLFSDFSRDVAMTIKSFVNVRYNMAKKLAYFVKYFRIYWTYFRNLFNVLKLFMYRFGQLPSSNLGVYTVKTCNFCSHAPTILGRSSYVTLAFRNGSEDRNFDFNRVIGKHFCTHYRNFAKFGWVTPEFKT